MSNSSNHRLYTVQNHENTNKTAFFFVFSRFLPQNPPKTPGNPFLGWHSVWVTTEMAHRRKNNKNYIKNVSNPPPYPPPPPPPPPRHSVQTNIFGSSTNKMFVGFVRRYSSTNIDEQVPATRATHDEQRRTSTNNDEQFFFSPPRRTSTNILFVCTLCLGGTTPAIFCARKIHLALSGHLQGNCG